MQYLYIEAVLLQIKHSYTHLVSERVGCVRRVRHASLFTKWKRSCFIATLTFMACQFGSLCKQCVWIADNWESCQQYGREFRGWKSMFWGFWPAANGSALIKNLSCGLAPELSQALNPFKARLLGIVTAFLMFQLHDVEWQQMLNSSQSFSSLSLHS